LFAQQRWWPNDPFAEARSALKEHAASTTGRTCLEIVDGTRVSLPCLNINIREHSPLSTRVNLPLAFDPDAPPQNTTARYGIYSQSSPEAFSLVWDGDGLLAPDDPTQEESEGRGLWLHVTRDLDRDTTPSHEVTLYASDAGQPIHLTGYLKLNITIDDINDHAPRFVKKFASTWILENSNKGTFVYRAKGEDADPSDAKRLAYSFGPTTSTEARQLFFMDSSTGEIRTIGPIDFEQYPVHKLALVLTDGKWTAEAELIVWIVNLNDHLPQVELTSYLATRTAPGYRPSRLSGQLVPSKPAVSMAGETGAGRSAGAGLIPFSGTGAAVTLVVHLTENGPGNKLIASLRVSDRDDVAEARLRSSPLWSSQSSVTSGVGGGLLHPFCQITGGLARSLFRIEAFRPNETGPDDPLTYHIRLAGQPLDREEKAFHAVPIECRDQEKPMPDQVYWLGRSLQDSQQQQQQQKQQHQQQQQQPSKWPQNARHQVLTNAYSGANLYSSYSIHPVTHVTKVLLNVIVDDVNDCPPVLRSPQRLVLREAEPIGTLVGVISAVDGDEPSSLAGNSGLRYYLAGEAEEMLYSPGEKKAVKSSISPRPQTTSRQSDKNVSHSGEDESETKEASVDAATHETVEGSEAARINGLFDRSRADESILPGPILPPKPWFMLDAVTGELRTSASFDREHVASIRLAVTIRDGGNLTPRASGRELESELPAYNAVNITLQIDLIDINDNPPLFTEHIYTFNVSEDARPPVRLGRVLAVDADVDRQNNRLEYWLLPNRQLNEDETAETVSNSPNSGGRGEVGKNLVTSQQRLLSALATWFTVTSGGEIYLRMSGFSSTNQMSRYPVNQIMPLDRELNDIIIFDVFAKDTGTPSLTGSAQVVIRVLDVNDNAPVWKFPKEGDRVVNVSVNAVQGHRIVQVSWHADIQNVHDFHASLSIRLHFGHKEKKCASTQSN
ncbi:unnamed protein product, partial [Protopolystoma xenopodis]